MIRVLLLAAASAALWPSTAAAQVVYAWGYNGDGELGNGTNTNSNLPVAVSSAGVLAGKTITAVAAGDQHSLALANGQVFAWGLGTDGALGTGNTSNSDVPVAVSTAGVLNGQMVTAIAAGNAHSLAVANGQVYAWGFNGDGELGNGNNAQSNAPVAVSTAGVLSGQTATAVAGGFQQSLAVANGQVYAWGGNGAGQLGNGTSGSGTDSNVPVAVSTAGVLSGQTVTAVAAGDQHSLALANGQVFAWGTNFYGQLGNGTNINSNMPVAVFTAGALSGKTVTSIAAGPDHSLAVANGQVYTWGDNADGELGNGSNTDSNAPVPVSSLVLSGLQATEVAAGYESSYALTSTGRLFAWGDNIYGELGIGVTGGTFTTPQEVLPPAGYIWTSVDSDADGGSVLAIATPVPEPGTLGLLGATFAAAALRRRTRRRSATAARNDAALRFEPTGRKLP